MWEGLRGVDGGASPSPQFFFVGTYRWCARLRKKNWPAAARKKNRTQHSCCVFIFSSDLRLRGMNPRATSASAEPDKKRHRKETGDYGTLQRLLDALGEITFGRRKRPEVHALLSDLDGKMLVDEWELGSVEWAHKAVHAKMTGRLMPTEGGDWVVRRLIEQDDLCGFCILDERIQPYAHNAVWYAIKPCFMTAWFCCANRITRYVLNKHRPALTFILSCVSEATIIDDVNLLKRELQRKRRNKNQFVPFLGKLDPLETQATKHGAFNIVRYLIKEKGIRPEPTEGCFPRDPLFYTAVEYDRLEIAQWLYQECEIDVSLGPLRDDRPPILVASPRCKQWLLTLPDCDKHWVCLQVDDLTPLGYLVFRRPENDSGYDFDGMDIGNSAIRLLAEAIKFWSGNQYRINIANNPRIGLDGIKKLTSALDDCHPQLKIKLVLGNQFPPKLLNLFLRKVKYHKDSPPSLLEVEWGFPSLYTIALHAVRNRLLPKQHQKAHDLLETKYKTRLPSEIYEALVHLVQPS